MKFGLPKRFFLEIDTMKSIKFFIQMNILSGKNDNWKWAIKNDDFLEMNNLLK